MDPLDRVAAAPISWGVCEVPGWGLELPRDRVLAEMRALGFTATELGSEGYLPTDPDELRTVLDRFGLRLVGGFVGLVLHDPEQVEATLAEVRRAATLLRDAGADVFVTAALTDWSWSGRRPLTDAEWRHLARMLAVVDDLLAELGLQQVLHPHVATVVERADEVERILESTEVALCCDTGHLAIGGADPVALVERAPSRIGHVHLKDVHLATARRVTDGDLTLMEGVQAGMFTPLGDGDVAIADLVGRLEASGYDGWYVLEQDAAITGGMPEPGSGPVEDVHRSLEHLQRIVASAGSAA